MQALLHIRIVKCVFLLVVGFVVVAKAAGTSYVWSAGSSTSPYDTWAKAATNIQDAVTYVNANYPIYDTVLVTNGNYTIGSELVLTNPVTVRSVNGADNTIIRFTGFSYDRSRIFCVSNAGAVVQGVTMRDGSINGPNTNGYLVGNGAGLFLANGTVQDCIIRDNDCNGNLGGGVYMTNGLLSNCIVTGNQLIWGDRGGGIYMYRSGVVANCVISSNNLSVPGSSYSAGIHCQNGGIVRWSYVFANFANGTAGGIECNGGGLIENSVISNNACWNSGGGVRLINGGRMRNSLVLRNTSQDSTAAGGGVYISGGLVENCTIISNRASFAGASGGGVYAASGGLTNSIIYHNTADVAPNVYTGVAVIGFCCTTDAVPGEANITTDPLFKNWPAGDFKLMPDSRCIAGGTNIPGMVGSLDLAGKNRVNGWRIDIGCFEEQSKRGLTLFVK